MFCEFNIYSDVLTVTRKTSHRKGVCYCMHTAPQWAEYKSILWQNLPAGHLSKVYRTNDIRWRLFHWIILRPQQYFTNEEVKL